MRLHFWFAPLLQPGILLLLAAAGMNTGVAGDQPPQLLFARFKQKVRQDIGRLANCTCLETIERSVREPGTNSFQFLDRVRLEVTTAGGKELLTWPGGARFEELAVTSFVQSGLVASGMFASFARNLFLNDGATLRYGGPEELGGLPTVRYDFRIPLLSSAYRLRSLNGAATVATKGSFWFDAGSLQIVRLDQFADEIPAELGLTEALIRIQYIRMPDGVPDVLLPQGAEIVLTHSSGEVRRNKIEFAQCREYRAESSVSFGSPGLTEEAPQAGLAHVDLPAALTIRMELESGFDSATAAIGDPVRARVVKEVRRSGKPILPKGAIATGRIRSMECQARSGGFLLGIEWTGMRWGNNRAEFRAELLEARTRAPIEPTRGLQAGNSNVVGLSGSVPSVEIPLAERSGTQIRVESGIPGVGRLFVKGEQWRLAPGLQMVWRTLSQ
jgi:hypothetical protein